MSTDTSLYFILNSMQNIQKAHAPFNCFVTFYSLLYTDMRTVPCRRGTTKYSNNDLVAFDFVARPHEEQFKMKYRKALKLIFECEWISRAVREQNKNKLHWFCIFDAYWEKISYYHSFSIRRHQV